MRSDRVLTVAGALAAVAAAVVLLVVLAGGRNRAADDALALSPTPRPFDIAWTVAGSEAVVGAPVTVTALAEPSDSGGSYGGVVSEPTYTLSIEIDAMELKSPAAVSPDDVLDGASWELTAVHEGETQLIVTLDYTLFYNITGTPPGSYHVTTETTETIEIAGAPNGDVNDDGRANSIDALLILQFTAGLLLPPVPNSDVNMSGATDSLDASLVLQFSAGLLPSLPWVPIPPVDGEPTVLPNGLEIYEIEVGTGAQVMTLNDTVTVRYTGYLENGLVFDSSAEPLQFALTSVITGWRQGLQGMRAGGERRLVIPPSKAYGETGIDGIVPPNATLTFDIELLSVP